jgi:ribosomal protein L7/L12
MQDATEDEIRQLLASGNKIAAIKRYREATGAGLAEAKVAVESLEAGGSFSERGRSDNSDLTDQIVDLPGRGEKIEAVKLYREQTGGGLKEAKEAVGRIGEQNGIQSSSGSGCLGIVLLGIVAALGLLC